uniref:ATPase family AAA domain containing 5a n=1 Tax=Echeneis naucrates TaxID=173247 RepID=A0A665ULH2_ECHNA
MKVNVDEALQSNNSTVTISFEDFVRSQSHKSEKGEDEQDKEKENQIMTGAEEIDTDQLENFGSEELPHNHQGSPRLVTIQAEVHVHSPKQEAVKAVGKLASIFNKRKESMSPGEVLVSPHIEGGHQSFSTSLTVKRKSNVVLQEEDLELAVLETESTPKCTEAERKQFMAAFKQPSLDGAKTKPGKTQTKQKQPGEKNSDANDKVVEEDTVISISVEQIPAPSQETNIAEKKQARRSRKNAKEANLAVTSPAHTPAEETAATVVDVDIKKEEPSVPALRRSRRGTVVRQAIEITPERLVRKPREQKESKNVPNAAAALPEIPVKMSTPKPRKSKHGVFVAEMVCPPDTKESPISQSLEDEALCRELLTESRRRGVDLLYSNMERLLPLPLKQLTTSNCRPESQDHGSVNPKELPLQHTVDSADYSDDGSPIKVSSRMREYKKKHCLPDNDRLNSDSDSEENFLSLCKPQVSPRVKEEVKERPTLNIVRRKPLTHEERVKSLPVSQCLESMAEFLDNMSYVDSSLTFYPEKGVIQRSPVSAVVKDGMTDELKTETIRDGWLGGEYISEIQAAVEFLSFRKCRISTAEAWDKAQQLEGELGKEATAELTLPVAPHCEGYSFIQDGPCHPQLVQERKEVMTSLMQRGAVGTLGNTSAVALDYLPALRTICRSEHLKEQGKMKRRFLHYLDGIHLGLQKSTLQHLAEDFP